MTTIFFFIAIGVMSVFVLSALLGQKGTFGIAASVCGLVIGSASLFLALTEPSDPPPVLSFFSLDPTCVEPRGVSKATAGARDPLGKTPEFLWYAPERGQIEPTKSDRESRYTAPDVPGSYLVEVQVHAGDRTSKRIPRSIVVHEVGDDRACQEFFSGRESLQAGAFAGAIGSFAAALATESEFWDARLLQGVAYTEIGEYSQALDAFKLALDSVDQNPAPYLLSAKAAVESGDSPSAASFVDSYLAAASDDTYNGLLADFEDQPTEHQSLQLDAAILQDPTLKALLALEPPES